jgi:hypothetical protein
MIRAKVYVVEQKWIAPLLRGHVRIRNLPADGDIIGVYSGGKDLDVHIHSTTFPKVRATEMPPRIVAVIEFNRSPEHE